MEVVLKHVAKKEKFSLPEEASEEIIKNSEGNMRRALLIMEALKMQSYVLVPFCSCSYQLMFLQTRPEGNHLRCKT